MNLDVPMGVVWAAGAFIATKLFDWVMGLKRKHDQLKDDTVKALGTSLDQNSKALAALEISIKSLEKSVAPIPKLQKDVNEAHAKIREINVRLEMTDKQ